MEEEIIGYIQPASLLGEYGMFLMIGGIVLVFYFFMIRPESKRKKKLAAMRNSLAVGDEIVTIEGIIGTIVALNSEEAVIETSEEKARLKITRWSISTSSGAAPEPVKDKKKIIIIASAVTAAVIVIVILLAVYVVPPMNQYNIAVNHFNEREYIEALTALNELDDDYRDVSWFRKYIEAWMLFTQGKFENAAEKFEELSNFRRSLILRFESLYQLANEHIKNEKVAEAIVLLELLEEYRDSVELLEGLR